MIIIFKSKFGKLMKFSKTEEKVTKGGKRHYLTISTGRHIFAIKNRTP